MLRKLLLSAAALSFTAPASAAFVVTFPSTNPLLSNNNFKSNLNALGFNAYATVGATITLNAGDQIRFDFFGSESGYSDTFSTTGVGALSKTETTGFTPWGAQLIGTQTFTAGSLLGQLNFTTTGVGGQNAGIGSAGFGIFTQANSTGFTGNVLWLGYDDQITRAADDNHDDFIVRATIMAVPEPATWAMMITGVGIAGVALRRRRRSAVAVSMA